MNGVVPVENLVNTASQKQVFIKQIKDVVAAIALNSLTLTTAPTKEPELIFYGECQKVLQEDVLRRIFRDQIAKRATALLPHCVIPVDIVDDEIMDELMETFSVSNPEERKVQGLYDAAKSVQSDCRARWTKLYDESVKAQGSGVNNDQASLELVLKEIQKERIRSNFSKAVSKSLAVALKNDPSADKATKKTELENDKRGYYDSKLARWKNEELPSFWLAFILCGAPGLRLAALVPDPAAAIAAKSTAGRQILRDLERSKREEKPYADNDGPPPKRASAVIDLTEEMTKGNQFIGRIADAYAKSVALRSLNAKKTALLERLANMRARNIDERDPTFINCMESYEKILDDITNFDCDNSFCTPISKNNQLGIFTPDS